mmetsp:Transcript_1891/g.4177  ORF Transcript_1891/g.4177 Transcript_1891/m.4177 type:complete len:121 (+) Transcript_1891:2036-2398(+)
MSYFATDEAWKQRIAQEVNRASRFRTTQESFYRSSSIGASNPNYIRTAEFVSSPKHSVVKQLETYTPKSKYRQRLHNLLEQSKISRSLYNDLCSQLQTKSRNVPAESRGKYAARSQSRGR